MFNIYLFKKIISTKWKFGTVILHLTTLISFSIITYHNLDHGYIMSPDSFNYSIYADELIKLKFNLYDFSSLSTVVNQNSHYTVIVPIILIALSKIIFENSWQYAFMLFNLILVFFSLILFSKSLLLLKVRPFIVALAMPVLTLSVDLLSYPRFILTDTIFSFFIISLVFFMVKSINNSKICYFEIIVLFIVISFSRPTAFPYIFAICLFIFIFKYQINFSSKLIIQFITILIMLIPILLAILHSVIELYFLDVRRLEFIIRYANEGVVVNKRYETYVQPPPVNFFENVYFYFIKTINFFKFYATEFSFTHKILNIFQNLIIFFSIFIWSNLKKITKPMNDTIIFILLLSLIVASFHSFTLIDYDWRFRYPLMLPLVMLFPISIEAFLRNNNIK